MIRASIDLGTNTCLLLIAEGEFKQGQPLRVLCDTTSIVRLGEGVDRERRLGTQAMNRVVECLKSYKMRVRAAGLVPEDVLAVATSQARDAVNSVEFFERVKRETGFVFRVISGEEEARSTFRGALALSPDLDADRACVIDIGGGSTELISKSGGMSVDMGSVRFTERFFKSDPVTDEEFWKCQATVDEELKKFTSWRAGLHRHPVLVGVAGTATTLAAWHLGLSTFDVEKVDGVLLTRGDVHRMVEELKWRKVEERRALPCMEPKRADVILAGALILWRVMEKLQFSECRVSTQGLRYGVLFAET